MRRIVVQKEYSPSFSVAGICLPLVGHHQAVTATMSGKESPRMKNRAESTPSRISERISPWHKLAAIGALSSIALTGCASQNVSAEPGPSVSVSASEASTSTPSETAPSRAEIEAKIEKLEIPAGLDTVSLGGAIIDRLNQWANDGSNQALYDRFMAAPSGTSIEDVSAEIAAGNREAYAVALFGEGYQGHPSVATYVNQSEGVNRDTVAAYGGTEWNDQATNSEGYRSWRELLAPYAQLISEDGGVRKYVFDYDFHDNADKNIVDEGTLPKGGKLFVTVEAIDGHDIITDITDQPVYAIG